MAKFNSTARLLALATALVAATLPFAASAAAEKDAAPKKAPVEWLLVRQVKEPGCDNCWKVLKSGLGKMECRSQIDEATPYGAWYKVTCIRSADAKSH